MAYSPEYLAGRRRSLVRRRRAFAAVIVAILVVAGGVGAYLLNQPHHVVIVHVAARPHVTAPKVVGSEHEYPAAPGAPTLKSVEKDLNRTAHTHHSNNASTAAASGGSVLISDASSSFEHLASSLPSRVELAVTPLGSGESEVLGGDEATRAWSTSKVPVLVSLIRARGSEGLTSEELRWAHAAITESDNQSVLDLFSDLERLKGGLTGASQYMDDVLRSGGDSETGVATAPPPPGAVTTFGQTQWSPGEAVRFFRALANNCLLSSNETSYVLGLMQSIEPSESWGLGSAGFNSVAFKGGWGPEAGGYLVRQSGIIEPGSTSGVAVAVVARAPSFSAGTESLTRVASWLKDHLVLSSHPKAGCGSE